MSSVLFNISDNNSLANKIVSELNSISFQRNLGVVRTQKFSDGELCVDYSESIRGKRIYILSSFNNSDELVKLNFAIDAAKRAGASEIIPILPYFLYARADKKDQPRGPIGAKVMAEMIEQRGATSIITFDLHADQIQGFFNIPVIHIQGKNVFDAYINNLADENTILCSPDAGGGKRVKRMRDQIEQRFGTDLDYIFLDKTRPKANVIGDMKIIGNVEGKHVIIIDDIVDTAGTLCKAAEVIMKNGAKSVRAVISHGICSKPALSRIYDSRLKELIISDSLGEEVSNSYAVSYGENKITIVSVAEQIALAITSLENHSSYETLKEAKWRIE